MGTESTSPALRPLACVHAPRPEALVPTCARLTPPVEHHRRMLALDLGGCERLILTRTGGRDGTRGGCSTWRDDASLWQPLAERLYKRLRAHCGGGPDDGEPQASELRVGLGATRAVAWLAATTPFAGASAPGKSTDAAWRCVLPHQVGAFLRGIPIAALLDLPEIDAFPATEEIIGELARAGIATLGQLARLPARALVGRFGPIGGVLRALAHGEDMLPFRPLTTERRLAVRLAFDGAGDWEQVAAALAVLATDLHRRLAKRHLAAGSLMLRLTPERGPAYSVVRSLARPAISPAALLDRARRLLAELRRDLVVRSSSTADGDPVLARIKLSAGELLPTRAAQGDLWAAPGPGAGPARAEERQARLALLAEAAAPLARSYGRPPILRLEQVTSGAVVPFRHHGLVPCWQDAPDRVASGRE